MPYDELTAKTVKVATTLNLLLERARDLSAILSRMNRCITGLVFQEFTYETGEGAGDTRVRVSRLNEHIKPMVTEVEMARARINSDVASKWRWKNPTKVVAFSSGACANYRS